MVPVVKNYTEAIKVFLSCPVCLNSLHRLMNFAMVIQ